MPNFNIIQYLIDKGANVNQTDTNLFVTLHKAAKSGQLEVIKLLVEVGKANLNAKNNNGDTPLLLAKKQKLPTTL